MPVRSRRLPGAVAADHEDRAANSRAAVHVRARVREATTVGRPGEIDGRRQPRRRRSCGRSRLKTGRRLRGHRMGERHARDVEVAPRVRVEDVQPDMCAASADLVESKSDAAAVRRPVDALQLAAEDVAGAPPYHREPAARQHLDDLGRPVPAAGDRRGTPGVDSTSAADGRRVEVGRRCDPRQREQQHGGDEEQRTARRRCRRARREGRVSSPSRRSSRASANSGRGATPGSRWPKNAVGSCSLTPLPRRRVGSSRGRAPAATRPPRRCDRAPVPPRPPRSRRGE